MRIVQPRIQIIDRINGEAMLKKLEKIGRVSHKSEGKITVNSSRQFVRRLIKSGHESVLEHISITVKIICDRGISHEIVRHRIASYTQESTRYCAYQEGIEIILPAIIKNNRQNKKIFLKTIREIEKTYQDLLANGVPPEIARNILPHCLKAEIYCTFNLREWRHIFSLRCARDAHPQIREIFIKILQKFQQKIPIVFDDFEVDEEENVAYQLL